VVAVSLKNREGDRVRVVHGGGGARVTLQTN